MGVPTVLDRFLQQALSQVLSPIFEPSFSDRSFGFRPGRSAHQAVEAARRAIEGGLTWVVDVDLDRFFDRVSHDALMARVARRVGDRRVLRLIRRYLDAGVMVAGVTVATVEGTPQGSPLSPLLANIMLDDLDHELERRGHTFVRYADDLRVYVASERAATRVLAGVTAFVEQRLHLRVNRTKSGVAPATVRGLLGFGFLRRDGTVKVRLDRKAKHRLKARLRRLTSRRWRVAMAVRLAALNRFLGGWSAYFALADTPSVFAEFDEWLRRRLRQVRWKEWKRFAARRRNLRALGSPTGRRANGRPAGRATGGSRAPLRSNGRCPTATGPTSVWSRSAIEPVASGSAGEPPDADPHVRWCGRGRCDAAPYPIGLQAGPSGHGTRGIGPLGAPVGVLPMTDRGRDRVLGWRRREFRERLRSNHPMARPSSNRFKRRCCGRPREGGRKTVPRKLSFEGSLVHGP